MRDIAEVMEELKAAPYTEREVCAPHTGVIRFADIKEGINAKVWTVGVVMGSNEMGLTQEEAACMTRAELEYRKTQVRRRMLEAGAHYVVDTIAELPDVIDDINSKLEEAR